MKTKRSSLSLLTLLLTLSLVSCGGNNNTVNPTDSSRPASGETSSDSPEHYSKTQYTDGMEFELNEAKDGYIVSQFISPDRDIVIPELYQGLPVREIAANVFQYISIDSLELPKSLRVIHTGAFFGIPDDSELERIDIPEGVTVIEDEAFSYCPTIKQFHLPTTLEKLGERVFSLDSALAKFTMDDDGKAYKVEHGILYTADGKELVAYPQAMANTTFDMPNTVEKIWSYAMYGNTILTSVSLGSGLKEVGERAIAALANVTNLSTTRAPLEKIGDRAFSENKALTSFELPASVTEFGKGVFYGDSNLVMVTFNFSFTELPEDTFYGCGKLVSYGKLPETLTKIGKNAFRGCLSLTRMTIPNSVTELGEGAFYGMTGLTSLSIPSGITKLPADLCYGDKSLTKVTLPSSLTQIDFQAFMACAKLNNINLEDTQVETIGKSAFINCEGMTAIHFPNTLKTIGDHAFASCFALTSAEFNEGLETIGEEAFYNYRSLTKVYIPKTVTSIGSLAFASHRAAGDVTELNLYFEAESFKNQATGVQKITFEDENHFHYGVSREDYQNA